MPDGRFWPVTATDPRLRNGCSPAEPFGQSASTNDNADAVCWSERSFSRSYEARPSSEQLLHHRLLERAGLFAAGFQRRQLGVHVGEDGGDGGLFRE
jgi:hypothetical protein